MIKLRTASCRDVWSQYFQSPPNRSFLLLVGSQSGAVLVSFCSQCRNAFGTLYNSSCIFRVLIHPNTDDAYRDHTELVTWMGKPWPLYTDILLQKHWAFGISSRQHRHRLGYVVNWILFGIHKSRYICSDMCFYSSGFGLCIVEIFPTMIVQDCTRMTLDCSPEILSRIRHFVEVLRHSTAWPGRTMWSYLDPRPRKTSRWHSDP